MKLLSDMFRDEGPSAKQFACLRQFYLAVIWPLLPPFESGFTATGFPVPLALV
jgi:hypothetical protein